MQLFRIEIVVAYNSDHPLFDIFEEGGQAFSRGEMRAPALNSMVVSKIQGLPVGAGASEIMKAFTDGFDYAVDSELAY